VDPAIDVLAVTEYGLDPDRPGLLGTPMPVTWTKRWGAGRVFVTILGHSRAHLEVPRGRRDDPAAVPAHESRAFAAHTAC
jgi:type 1 glutamine amidotransferase